MASNNNNNNNKTGGSSNIKKEIEIAERVNNISNMANNKSTRTPEEWHRLLNKKLNAMKAAYKKRKWARAERALVDYNNTLVEAFTILGGECERHIQISHKGVTVEKITKEEFKAAQERNHTNSNVIYEWTD